MTESLTKMETKVTLLLQVYAKDDTAKWKIAPHVAKTSLEMGHLYSDLGLRNRFEMGHYMQKYFPNLAKKKPRNKLWKKFIYDSIDEVAPACAECKDSVHCFACKDSPMELLNLSSMPA